ncbi:MAG TPA: gamma-glutamylcyclotransferase family protein [Orrella sp.]
MTRNTIDNSQHGLGNDNLPDSGAGERTGKRDVASPVHVFTYGSLMYEDIFAGVTQCQAIPMAARLNHWARHGLRAREYPGALPEPSGQSYIDGVVWLNVTEQALARLDQFEGSEYERVVVTVQATEGTTYLAQVYQWQLPAEVSGQWCVQTFEQLHRDRFLHVHSQRRV